MPHQPRAKVLQDEAFVAVVRPHVPQHVHMVVAPRDMREPLFVFGSRQRADTLDILHHGKTERVGIQAVVAAVVELGLEHDVGVR